MSEQNNLTPGGIDKNRDYYRDYSIDQRPVFFLLSGPPGAGKTTSGLAVAPPEIKEILNYDTERSEYTQMYLKKYPNTTLELADADAKYSAGKAVNNKMDEALSTGTSFGMEGMIWDNKSWEGCQKFQDLGFRFDLAYLGIESAEKTAQRVENRIEDGGHTYVTGDLAKTIFSSNLKALNENFRQPDRLDLYDNTHNNISFIAALEKGVVKEVGPGPVPDWVTKQLPAISERMDQYKALNQSTSQAKAVESALGSNTTDKRDQKPEYKAWEQKKGTDQNKKGFKL